MYKETLKDLRAQNNIKQQDLANYLNLSVSSYATYENEIDIFPIKHLNNVCNFFNVSLDYIFNLEKLQQYKDNNQSINTVISGTRLKELRKEHKLTQKQLSEILKSDNSTISKYEKGINIIATPFLYDICKKYNISADYLLGKIDKKNQE